MGIQTGRYPVSIWCSMLGIDGEMCPDPSRPGGGLAHGDVATGVLTGDGGVYGTKPFCTGCEFCEKVGSPWVYQRSHVTPKARGERGGVVELAYIAHHIPTPKENAATADYVERDYGDPAHPWLRVGVNSHREYPTVVLSVDQVRVLRDQLSKWLDQEFLPLREYE